MQLFVLLAALLQLVAAISFDPISHNTTLLRTSTYNLTWSTVDTDPSLMSIYLWNFAVFPPFYTPLQKNINVAQGWMKVRIPCAVAQGGGFQFTAINGSNVYVIYAQSSDFTVQGGNCQNGGSLGSCSSTS